MAIPPLSARHARLVRLACLLELSRNPFFRLLVVDARTYHDTAAAMASGAYLSLRANILLRQPRARFTTMTMVEMVAMLQGGLAIAPIITHRFRVDAFEEAFQVMRSGQAGKVILDWD